MSALLVHVAVPETTPTVVTLTGEVDIASVAVLRHHLLSLPTTSTIVELSGVQLLSAIGLNELVCLRERLACADAFLALAAASRAVRRVLGATRIADTVVLADSVEEATRLIDAGSRRTSGTARTRSPG